MMDQRKEFEDRVSRWANEQENLGDDIEKWSMRVYVYAAKQSMLLTSPIPAPEVHDIAWSAAKWKWGAERYRDGKL